MLGETEIDLTKLVTDGTPLTILVGVMLFVLKYIRDMSTSFQSQITQITDKFGEKLERIEEKHQGSTDKMTAAIDSLREQSKSQSDELRRLSEKINAKP